MYVIQCCCVFCLLLPVPSGTGVVTKSVCSEDSIVLFENVLDSRDTVVSIYMNHQTHIIIAEWEVKNLTIMSHIQPGYEEKVYLSNDGSIWLHNVNHGDQEKYFIVYGRDTPDVKYEVEIHVMVAPQKNCKVKITHGDKILIASLEGEDCGTPVVSVQWLDHPGISNTSEPMINLPPGNEAGTYYACLKGPALECAKISTLSDYCSSYTIRGNDSPPLSSQPSADTSDLTNAFFVMGSFVMCSFLLAAILIYMIWRKRLISENLQRRKTVSLLKSSWQQKKDFEMLKKDQVQKWLNDHPYCMKNVLEIIMEDLVCKWLNDHPDFMEKYLGQCIRTHRNDLEGTEQKTIQVEGENQPLLGHSDTGRSSPRRSFDTSTFEEEGNDTVYKGLVEGDPLHMIPQRQPGSSNPKKATGDSDHSIPQSVPDSFNPKMSIGSPDGSLLEEISETVDKYPVQVPKPTGTRPKSITPLPPEKP